MASAVLVAAALVVGAAVVVGLAAVGSVLLGVAAARILYAEVVQTRHRAARDRADQARAFGTALTAAYVEHTEFRTTLTSRLAARDRAIAELAATVRLVDSRADEAAALAVRETLRAEREQQRADDAQGRLSALLDEVLAYQVPPLRPDEPAEGEDDADALSTVVDLLAWEERSITSTTSADVRKHA